MSLCVLVIYFIGFSFAQFSRREGATPQLPDDGNRTTTTTATPHETTFLFSTSNVLIYVGIGVAVLAFVIILQTICFIIYTRRVKVTRRRIEEMMRPTSKSDDGKERYSQQPTKIIDSYEMDLYESLPDVTNKKPAPPPIETLPRKKSPPSPLPVRPPLLRERTNSTSSSVGSRPVNIEMVPPKRVPGKHFSNTSSISRSRERIPTPREFDGGKSTNPTFSMPRNKERMPTPREIDDSKETMPIRNRSRMPLPNEMPPDKHATLPTLPKLHHKDSPRIGARKLPSLSPTEDTGVNSELMAKLRRRAALTEALASHTANFSLPLPPPPVHTRPKKTVAVPYPKPTKLSYTNDSDVSDDEWTIEQLKPINLYNV